MEFKFEKMKRLRAKLGLSYQGLSMELAHRFNYRITGAALEQWEKGRVMPRACGVRALALLAGKPMDWFFLP